MDPPPPYDPRRHPHYTSHPYHSHPQPSSSNSDRFAAAPPSYYHSNRSRASSELPPQSGRVAGPDRGGSSKHQRGNDAAAGSSDQRDHKRSRVDVRERNSRSAAYDGKANNNKDQDSNGNNNNYRKSKRNQDKEKRKNSKRTPQKANSKSKASVWSRIEKKPSSSSHSPSSSNRSNQVGTDPVLPNSTRPDNELTGPVIQPDKESDHPVQDKELNPVQNQIKTEVSIPDETGTKKKKVVIRRTIVKKSKNNPAGSCSSPQDQIKELSGSGSGVRRVKRVIIVKKKKGEASFCNEEEIVRQIANQVFSENKSVEGSKISPEMSVNDIDSKPSFVLSDKGILVRVESTAAKNSSDNNMAGTSGLKICAKEEVVETDLNVGPSIYCMDPVRDTPSNVAEAIDTLGCVTGEGNKEGKETGFNIGSIMQENQESNNINIDVNINSFSAAVCENTGDAINGIQDLNSENLGFQNENIETEMNDLNNLGQNLPQNFIESSENQGNFIVSTNEGNICPEQLEMSSTMNGEDHHLDGKSVILPGPQDELIQKYLNEIKKDIFQQPVPVPVPVPPKFPTASAGNLNQKPRHKTWRRDDVIIPPNNNNNNNSSSSTNNNNNNSNQTKMAQSSYIRKGNSLIRSASGNNIIPSQSIPPRIPSPNLNPNPNSTVTSPLNDSESEAEKLGLQGNNQSNKMVYLKKKSNQIVLNSGSSSDNSQSLKSNNSNIINSDVNSGILKLLPKNKIHHRVMRQINKAAIFPNVWTLNSDIQTKRKIYNNYNKSIPLILPWKRTTFLKNSTRKAPILINSPTSFLIRKLVLARKRDTVYKVSKGGFSICKAGVLSIGGSNLKWSRSIDTDSKKANQEATMAVAEAERKKREKRKQHLHNKTKKGPKTPLNLNKPTSSTRYMRVTKGNSKKLVRILASEKVQRSLHTLRTRYKRKNKGQFCLFYTRFGFCNKKDGMCNYVHDPAKIAICTKFLRGLCVNSDCKLTHEIKPERMPDCSYFLLGLCTNLSCPYRHVKVNPNAPICEGFLRGYCSDGDDCRKKHSYTCPQFEKNGECPQGPKCKLYHPKLKSNKSSTSKSRKRKSSSFLQNPNCIRPRYFESSIDFCQLVVGKEKNGSDIFPQGQFGDFMILDEDESSSTAFDAVEEMRVVDEESEGSDLEMDDELIKPVKVIRDSGLVV